MDFGDYLLVVLLLGVALVQGRNENQGGSISVNCGGVGYTEYRTGVKYVPDGIYITSGVTRNISHEFQKPDRPRYLWDLRSFPDGIRNCYYFNLTKGDRYLIRAEFFYGNYDGLNSPSEFKIYIGSAYDKTISFLHTDTKVHVIEIIYTIQSSHVDLCVAKTTPSIPFISSIELRPIQTGAYNSPGLFETLYRYDFGSTSNDANLGDRFGRHWVPQNFDSSFTPIKTEYVVDTSLLDEDPPEASMKTALVPSRIDGVMTFTKEMLPSQHNDEAKVVYIYMYFAELYNLKDGEVREFTIYKNGHIWRQPFSPTYLKASVEHGHYNLLPNETLKFEFERTQRSTLPPLINALEVYQFHNFSGKDTASEDVTAVRNIKIYYRLNKLKWQGDPCSPPTYIWDGVKCDTNLHSIPVITSLNLSSSKLEGVLIPDIFHIRKLTDLDLSNNNLTGTIPEFLSQMHELKVINLRGNKFYGTIPQGLRAKKNQGLLQLSVEDNPSLCVSGNCNPDNSNNHLLAIFASVASILVLVSAIASIVVFLKKRKKSQSTNYAASVTDPNPNPPNKLSLAMQREVSHAEIERITNSFAKIIGQGGFGTVFYGVLETKQAAIKLVGAGSLNQFIAEVGVLLRVHHKSLVQLIGYCREAHCTALIYEFMVNGDLKDHLSGKSGRFLRWETRLKIATQVAQGLEYLHHGCNPPIIHRDIKTRNILLDENFDAKLGDFGLSKSLPSDEATHVSTLVAGTHGYIDPEYLTSKRLTEKSDVYSFGIVLLELITNHKVHDKSRERPLIADWANFMVAKGETEDIIDPQLCGQFHPKSLHDAMDIAIACINEVSSNRPGMDRVALGLNDCLALEMTCIEQDYWTQSSISPR